MYKGYMEMEMHSFSSCCVDLQRLSSSSSNRGQKIVRKENPESNQNHKPLEKKQSIRSHIDHLMWQISFQGDLTSVLYFISKLLW